MLQSTVHHEPSNELLIIIVENWAILAIGRGGRETTLWTEQKEFFDNKFAILYLQTNLTQRFRQSFVQNSAD